MVAVEIDSCFDSARSFATSNPEAVSPFVAGARAMLSTKQEADGHKEASSTAPVTTLGEAYHLYLTDPRHSRGHRTTEAYLTTKRWVDEFFGADTPITSITRERCREFVSFLQKVPKHAHKRYPGLPLTQVVEATKGDPAIERINAAHINGYLNKFAGALNWAEQEGLILRNPAKGLRIPDPVRRKDKRRPFSDAQLQRIFSAPIFTGCEDDEQGYARPGPNRPRRARFWIPLIALTSGMRLNEICQLDVNDVLVLDGVACLICMSAEGNEQMVFRPMCARHDCRGSPRPSSLPRHSSTDNLPGRREHKHAGHYLPATGYFYLWRRVSTASADRRECGPVK